MIHQNYIKKKVTSLNIMGVYKWYIKNIKKYTGKIKKKQLLITS